MGRERNNTFRKALRHLKSSQIDEKLQLLSEIPTNNTTGIYVIEPESIVQDPDIPGEVTREANFDQDALNNGRDTTGLFDVDNTTILTIEPPGDTTYILGPMSAMWYAWGNFSTIGYIRQSDRRMVDLGRITGQLGSWNGSSNFTSYGQLSLEQAVWFRDTPKLNGADNDTPNYRAFYPGPPSNAPDQYGRYLCVITGTSKETTVTPPPRRVPPVMGNPNDAGYPWGLLGSLSDKLKGLVKGLGNFFEPLSSLAFAGATFGSFLLQQQGLVDYTKSNPYQATLPPQDAKEISQSLNNVVNTIPRERWENLNGNDLQKINNVLNPGTGPTPSNPDRKVGDQKNTDEYHLIVNNIGRSDAFKGNIKIDPITKKEYVSQINDNYVFTNDSDASVKGAPELINFFATSFGAQNRPDMQQSKDIYARTDQLDTSDPDGTKWKIGEEIKLKNMPISVPLPAPSGGTEYKYNPAGGGMGGKRGGAVKEAFVLSEDHRRILREIKQPVAVKEQPRTQKLEKYRPNFAGKYTSQNTPDVTACPQSDEMVKAKNAAGQTWRLKDRHWSRYESTERMNIIFDNVGHGSQYWDMIINENQNKKGIRDRAVQEHLNMIAHNRAMLSEDPTYQSPFRNNIEEQETIQADQDPLFKKVAKRLKPAIDYPNKPSPNGFPTEPPPEMIDGWHPEYGNKSNYYNTLDPHSANSMPATGNAEIDAKVRRAKTLKRVLGKRA
jgi:hypothetical protein